jgi:hypothetical protein
MKKVSGRTTGICLESLLGDVGVHVIIDHYSGQVYPPVFYMLFSYEAKAVCHRERIRNPPASWLKAEVDKCWREGQKQKFYHSRRSENPTSPRELELVQIIFLILGQKQEICAEDLSINTGQNSVDRLQYQERFYH